MGKYGTWARIQADVNMLPERQDAGRALSAEEEFALLLEWEDPVRAFCSRSCYSHWKPVPGSTPSEPYNGKISPLAIGLCNLARIRQQPEQAAWFR